MGAVLGVSIWAVGCGGTIEAQETAPSCGAREPVAIPALVDTDWSPEQQEAILDGLEFWKGQVGDWVTFDVAIADCDELEPGCIAAVSSDNAMLVQSQDNQELEAAEKATGESLRVVGVTMPEAMVLDASFGGTGALFRHEWGHRLGLRHKDGGVMTLTVGSSEITPAVEADLRCHGLR